MLGHHENRMHDVPGTQMNWNVHKEIHAGEVQALHNLGLPGNAFNIAPGNIMNQDNLPPRRQYGNIQGPLY